MEVVAESSGVFLPMWTIILGIIIAAVLLYGYWPFMFDKLANLPGPKPDPFFGTIRQVMKRGMVDCDVSWRNLYGRVHSGYNGRQRAIHVGDPDMLKTILVKEFAHFQDRQFNFPLEPLQKNNLFFLSGDHWRFVRSILTPTFTSGKMRGMNPLIQKCITSLENNLGKYSDSGETFTPKDLFGAYTMDVIASVAFGIDTDSQNDPNNAFVKNAVRMFKINTRNPILWIFLGFPHLGALLVKLVGGILPRDAREFFTSILTKTIEQRKIEKQARQDFLQLLIEARKEELSSDKHEVDFDTKALNTNIDRDGLTDDEVMAQAFLFMIAGYETTGTAMTFLSYCLATNPEWQDKVIKEVKDVLKGEAPDYDNVLKLETLEMCLNETLRRHPPLLRSFRSAERDMSLNGYFIPKGAIVVIPVYSIQHDPELYPDPETYDPNRFSKERKHEVHQYSFLPFGQGPRNCVGQRLALMEIRMAFAQLLQQFKFVICDETQIPLEQATLDSLGGINKPNRPIRLKVVKQTA